jgi:hypothetical protein
VGEVNASSCIGKGRTRGEELIEKLGEATN